MKRASIAVIVAMLLANALVCRVFAQDELGEDSKVNTNLAFTITAPLNPTAQFVNVGGGLVVGAGYNVSKRNAFIGEFMWNRLGASDAALATVRDALQTHDVNGHGNLFALTGNYRFEVRGKTTGVYFIGGGGWYRRTANLSTPVATGSSISCTRTWEWWGFECKSGTVVSDQTVASSTSDVLGVNGGIGVTFKVAEPRYRVYVEARYHYAPTKNVKTELIPVTVGIRF
jgi:hypothetical protein